jgi:hypothetical protein
LDSQYKNKYRSKDLYEKAKSLKNTLVELEALKNFDDFFSENTDFLNPELVTLTAVLNMHGFSVLMSRTFSKSYPVHLVGSVLLELCKFCVALLQL